MRLDGETWEECDARLRHTPGSLLAYALEEDEGMRIRVTTESGAIYEFENDEVRRTSDNHTMRRDERWTKLLSVPVIVKGRPMRLHMPPFVADAVETLRITTPVVTIEPVF